MSRLDDLSNNLKAKGEQFALRIQESEIFQKLNERYQALTPQGQVTAMSSIVIILIVVIVFSPITSYFESQSKIDSFETQRGLIKDLFKTYREANKDAGITAPPPPDLLINQINSQLKNNQLLAEQIVGITTGLGEGRLIPSRFVREVVSVTLAKLNLRQIVDIGRILTRLSDSVKLKDMNVTARTDMNGYFDVTFKLYALNIPEMQILESTEIEASPKRGNRSGKGDADTSEGDE